MASSSQMAVYKNAKLGSLLKDIQIRGVNNFKAFASVVQCSNVWALHIMSFVLGLESVEIDLSIAFCQADIVEMIYIEMP